MFITKVILAFKLHILFITCYIPLHILFYILYTRPFSYKHVMYLEHAPSPTLFPFHLFQTVSLLLSSPYMCVYNICDQYVRSLMYLGVYTHSYICVHAYVHRHEWFLCVYKVLHTEKRTPRSLLISLLVKQTSPGWVTPSVYHTSAGKVESFWSTLLRKQKADDWTTKDKITDPNPRLNEIRSPHMQWNFLN